MTVDRGKKTGVKLHAFITSVKQQLASEQIDSAVPWPLCIYIVQTGSVDKVKENVIFNF